MKKILHRVLKTHFFVTSKKLVKMGDFGISKIVATTAISTAHYLSPDICRGQPESESDLRSLGTIIKLSRLWGKKQQF